MANSYRSGSVHTNLLTTSELQTEFRDYKLKVLNNEITFTPSKDALEKHKDVLSFISHHLPNDIISGSLALNILGLLHRPTADVDMIIDDKNRYSKYVKDGYDELLWKELKENRLIDPNKTHYGVWITCFVVFDNKSDVVIDFLNMWYLQTLKYTTQDQISFPYVVQKIKLYPYTLPNGVVLGKKPHEKTLFYIKQNHGK
jgi:hypothetical protein